MSRLRTPSIVGKGILLGAGILLGIGASLGFSTWASYATKPLPSLPWQQANLFADVYERVHRDYIDETSDEHLMTGALHGMVSSLDQYSAYLDAKEYAEMRITTSGTYSGVGIEFSLEGALKVIDVFDDSPAARAGIRGGDIVIAIDQVPVDPAHLDQATERLRGKPGEKVALDIRRGNAPQPLHFELVRRKVQVHSVKAELLETGFGYVHVAQFSETTADDFAAAVEHLQNNTTLRGLILDLRNNPGGVMEAAVAIADDFLDSGVIVTAQGRATGADFSLQAHPGDLLNGAPIVVLVNGRSASASEIVASALQDNHRARLIGQTTFGKGLVQTLTPLAQGGAIKLTTSRYFTPSGTSINQRGITPDMVVTNDTVAPPISGEQSQLLIKDAELRIALGKLKSLAVKDDNQSKHS